MVNSKELWTSFKEMEQSFDEDNHEYSLNYKLPTVSDLESWNEDLKLSDDDYQVVIDEILSYFKKGKFIFDFYLPEEFDENLLKGTDYDGWEPYEILYDVLESDNVSLIEKFMGAWNVDVEQGLLILKWTVPDWYPGDESDPYIVDTQGLFNTISDTVGDIFLQQ